MIVAQNTAIPWAIALDPMHGTIYWTDCGQRHIERAGMDGSQRQIIINTDIVRPTGLTLDFTSKRMYWCDSELKAISSSTFDGQHVNSIEISSHPFSISTFEDFVYWTDWRNGAIFKARNFIANEPKSIVELKSVCEQTKNFWLRIFV